MQRADGGRIPVRVVTETPASLPAGTALLRLAAPIHAHAPGAECPACAGRSDVRAVLFNLLEEVRLGLRPAFDAVSVDASALPDTAPVIDALAGRLPATGLRDHTVARRFVLKA